MCLNPFQLAKVFFSNSIKRQECNEAVASSVLVGRKPVINSSCKMRGGRERKARTASPAFLNCTHLLRLGESVLSFQREKGEKF